MAQRPLDDWDLADARGEKHVRASSIPAELAARVRSTLEQRAARLAEDLAAIERQERASEDGARAQYGKRIGDHTSDALETRRNVAASDTLRTQQGEVQRALGKLDDGSYGRCDGCGGPIGEERLEALPWAAECVGCRAKRRG